VLTADVVIPVAAAVVGAIIGALVMRAIERGWRRLDGRHGTLRGEWWQYIPPHEKDQAKLDHVRCSHVGDVLSASIVRVYPAPEPPAGPRQWAFTANVRRRMIFGAFSNKDPDDLSYGTMLLKMIGSGASQCTGFYNRLTIDHDGKLSLEEIVEIPVHWSRSRPAMPISDDPSQSHDAAA
jgi:hypothetical protein